MKKAHQFWEGRRVGRSSWEGFFARFYKFWDKFLQNSLTRLAPRSARRGRRILRLTPHAADPEIMKKLKM